MAGACLVQACPPVKLPARRLVSCSYSPEDPEIAIRGELDYSVLIARGLHNFGLCINCGCAIIRDSHQIIMILCTRRGGFTRVVPKANKLTIVLLIFKNNKNIRSSWFFYKDKIELSVI